LLLARVGTLGDFTPSAVIRHAISTPIDTLGWTQDFSERIRSDARRLPQFTGAPAISGLSSFCLAILGVGRHFAKVPTPDIPRVGSRPLAADGTVRGP
jgi:hypothetical protein